MSDVATDVDDFTVSETFVDPPAPEPTAPAETAGTGVDTSESIDKGEHLADPSETASADAAADESKPDRDEGGRFKSKRKDPQARIDELTRNWRDTERERNEAKARAEQLERELAAYRQPKTPEPQAAKPAAGDPEPREEDFQNYKDFVKAQAKWEIRQELAERERRETEARTKAEQARKAHTWTERMLEAEKRLPDFREVVQNAVERTKHRIPALAVEEAIMQSERGPDILHYLGTHPEECDRLLDRFERLPVEAADAVREVLEAKLPALSAHGPDTAASRSFVPPPIKPVGSAPVVSETPAEEEEDLDRFIERNDKKTPWHESKRRR